jgi:hypothetical protein
LKRALISTSWDCAVAKAPLIRAQKLTVTELCAKSAANYSANWMVSESCVGERRSKRKISPLRGRFRNRRNAREPVGKMQIFAAIQNTSVLNRKLAVRMLMSSLLTKLFEILSPSP